MDPDSSPRRRAAPASRTQGGERSGEADLIVSVTDGRGRAVRDGGLGRWLSRVAPRTARGEVAVALVPDARMRVLNRSYRRKDYATDVLSFPADSVFPQHQPRAPRRGGRVAHPAPRTAPPALGDIVIASGVAKRQARDAGHSYQTELRVLALHGLLHLLGYDHESPGDGGRMRLAEIRLRKKGGLPLGLMERVHAAEKRPRAGVRPREPEKRLRLGPSGRRAAARSAAREGARAGVGPREPKK